jgi:multidrug efflux pump subunit AcrB
VAVEGPILKTYVRLLRMALNHRMTVLLSGFGFLILLYQLWFLTVGLKTPVEFFPSLDPNSAYVNVELPEGADLEYIDRILKQIEVVITGMRPPEQGGAPLDEATYASAYAPRDHKRADGSTYLGPGDIDNMEYVYAKAVETAGSLNFGPNAPNHIGVQFIDFDQRAHPSAEDLEEIRRRIKQIPGAQITVAEAEEGPPTGAPINIEISGDDFKTLGKIAAQVKAFVEKVPFVEDVQDDYVEGLPSIQVDLDRQKAALFGLSTNDIGSALKTAYNGLDVSTYHEGDEDYDITIILPPDERNVTDVLHRLMIPSPSGQLVPLTTLGRIVYTGTIGDIVRINNDRVVTVKANVDETKVPGPVARQQAEDLLREYVLPPGYRIKFTGEFEFQKESEEFLTKAFMIAVFLIFLILVSLFNSVAQPLIILTSVILSLGGVFLGLAIMHMPFGIIMSGVGVISLAGVVVNNAIVLIDYTNKLLARGMDLTEAVVAAGATRLRPVLLTAITTVLGLLPMVTGISFDFHIMQMSWVSDTAQWWRSMAVVVIFGLMLATLLTLLVVPTLYAMIFSTREALKNFINRLKPSAPITVAVASETDASQG